MLKVHPAGAHYFSLSSFRRLLLSASAAMLVLFAGACSSSRIFVTPGASSWDELLPPDSSQLTYRVFLVGDAGRLNTSDPALSILGPALEKADERSAVVFLGDNVYDFGLPDSSSTDRPSAETALLKQLKLVADFPGKIVFIPGNHDWNDNRRGGLEAVARQEKYVEDYLDRGNVFVPDNGFPGPTEIKLTDRIRLLALDTQWWFASDRPFGETGDYTLREPSDFLVEAEHLLTKNRNNDVLVVGHHPLMSNGDHGGHYAANEHLAPFPVLGTLRVLYRQFFGGSQDFANAKYRLMRRELRGLFDRWDGDHLIYAAGHDHSLQYFQLLNRRKTQHFLVSGAGSATDYVAKGRGAAFTASIPGYSSIQYYADNSVWLEVHGVTDSSPAGELLFRTQLRAPFTVLNEEPSDSTESFPVVGPEDLGASKVVAANQRYRKRGFLQKFFLGTHHRNLWEAEVEAPILNVATAEGGLLPVREGGRSQTVTMRFRNANGRFFMLRSIDKVAGRIWPAELQQTFARDVVQDQFAMLNPYGAFLVARLARSAGVYHTNPQLVYVPESLQFDGEETALAGQLALFEERPDGDMTDLESMGNAPNVISTVKMLSEVTDDNDHRVDARFWAKTRLFDMLVADWDRSRPNFRWAEFEPFELNPSLTGDARKQGKIYRPVPRDRDLAMTRINGLFPTIYKTFFERAWQDFDSDYGYVKGLNKKGSAEDRRFTASLSREDWTDIAESIVRRLSDDSLRQAVEVWPEPIRELEAERTIEILKARRSQLPAIASKYYDLITRVVDIVGSNKHERFAVRRLNNAETEVVMYKTSKEGEIRKELFRRTFLSSETREIRLYGLGGNDTFLVSGGVVSGIRIRAVGGPGNDSFYDASSLDSDQSYTVFYDSILGNEFDTVSKTKVVLSDDPAYNSYNADEFQFDKTEPLLFFGSNKDDGIFIGGGAAFTVHGFRKTPYAAKHNLMANFASTIEAFNIRYRGHYVGFAGKWDMQLATDILFPNNIRNFYGLGNESTSERGDAKFYQARLKRISLTPALRRTLGEGISLTLAPHLEYTAVREDEDRFIAQPQSGVAPNTFRDQTMGGLAISVDLVNIDNPVNPKHGFRWTTTADFNKGIRNISENFSRFSSDLSLFVSPSLSPQLTFAARVGGSHNVGKFPFYSSNALGGKWNLRGFRSTRFAGRSSFFTNVDVRLKIFDFSGYVAFGDVGILGFADSGRVWADGENSDVWHTGYGFGVWSEIFSSVVLNGTAGFSDEDETFTLGFGFQF